MKALIWLALTFVGLVAVASCGSGKSEASATESCNKQREAQRQCFNAAVFAACVKCQEECGNDCLQTETCPLMFHCR